MNLSEIVALFIATAIFVASPGPGIFALVASSLVNRLSVNLSLSVGLITGDMIYLSLAMLGMSKIILLWSDFFFFVQLIGGAYLIFLGIKTIFSKPELMQNSDIKIIKKPLMIKQFSTAVLISLSNPKTILFYLGFLPAFINLENLDLKNALGIGGVISLAAITVCLIYISASRIFRKILSNEKQARYFYWIAGGLMVIVGFYLESRVFHFFDFNYFAQS